MNLRQTFYLRRKYYSPLFTKTAILEMLKPSALNRVISPLLIGMFFELCMFGVCLFILAESVQVGKKAQFCLPRDFYEFDAFLEKINALQITLVYPNYKTSVGSSKKN